MNVKVLTDSEGKAILVKFGGITNYIYTLSDREHWQPYSSISYNGGSLTPIDGVQDGDNYYFTFDNVNCSIENYVLNPVPQPLS